MLNHKKLFPQVFHQKVFTKTRSLQYDINEKKGVGAKLPPLFFRLYAFMPIHRAWSAVAIAAPANSETIPHP